MRRVWVCLWLAMQLAAADRKIAITIDDLPRGGDRGPRTLPAVRAMTERLLKPFRDRKLPVIGFVNEGNAADLGPGGLRRILDLWLDAGADLGNHAYSHININQETLEDYTADIVKGEPVVRAALAARGKTLRYFRHPFLFTGSTPEIQKGMQEFLDRRHYRVAPVTLDNADYMYAALYNKPEHRDRVRREYVPYMESMAEFFEKRSVAVLGREIPQVLLIHASQMNADLMPELLAMFQRRGYRIVSLDEALADEAYRLPDGYLGKRGISWIHRWTKDLSADLAGEPDPPKWVQDAWAKR